MPEIGDADGGRLLPLVERGQCDPRGVFAVAAAMFGRRRFGRGGGRHDAGGAVAHGRGRRARVCGGDRLRKPAGVLSRMFPSGGYAVMRTGWERDAHQMIVDVGPLGCPVSAGHGHADLLSIQCSAFGEPVLVDAGTYCYTPETEWRNYLPRHGSAQHRDDRRLRPGRDRQARSAGEDVRACTCASGARNAECDFVDASHDGYDGITHRRRVLFVKPDYWVVVDDVTADLKVGTTNIALHQIDLGFQFAPMSVSLGARSMGAGADAGRQYVLDRVVRDRLR